MRPFKPNGKVKDLLGYVSTTIRSVQLIAEGTQDRHYQEVKNGVRQVSNVVSRSHFSSLAD